MSFSADVAPPPQEKMRVTNAVDDEDMEAWNGGDEVLCHGAVVTYRVREWLCGLMATGNVCWQTGRDQHNIGSVKEYITSLVFYAFP